MWPVVLHLGMIQHEETPGSNERQAAREGGYFTAVLLPTGTATVLSRMTTERKANLRYLSLSNSEDPSFTLGEETLFFIFYFFKRWPLEENDRGAECVCFEPQPDFLYVVTVFCFTALHNNARLQFVST